PVAGRAKAAEFLAFPDRADYAQSLLQILDTDHGTTLRSAVLDALLRLDRSDQTPEILKRWTTLPPPLRTDAMATLLTRPNRAAMVLEAIKSGEIPASDITAAQ